MNNNINEEVLNKWKYLIGYCKAYYIDSSPTGISDSEYDDLERRAIKEDGFYVRDYVFNTFLKGTRTKNAWIEKIKKVKVHGTMMGAMVDVQNKSDQQLYFVLKYDGSSLALYLDPKTGKPLRIVTVGNLNIDDYGVDQTWKLLKFVPKSFPKGIVAIQMEALIDTSRLPDSPERARQKANGLINSKYAEDDVNNLITLRAFRYYTDDSKEGQYIRSCDYRDVLNSFGTVISPVDGHIRFAAATSWKLGELQTCPGYPETSHTVTDTGTFLNDGWVVYGKHGDCLGALKYSGAGGDTEVIKTTVLGIQWNSQTVKGKDSWSANVLIEPVTINGCTIRKPSAGSVKKLVDKQISQGAEVSIILANSTIPMIGDVFSPGTSPIQWPICSCGYQMGPADVYGSLLKCGNRKCTERFNRMFAYLRTVNTVGDINLDTLLVIDRFKFPTDPEIPKNFVSLVLSGKEEESYKYLESYLTTILQKRTLSLVWRSAFDSVYERFK